MTKTERLQAKAAKIARRITLLQAQTASALGQHDEARKLFASCGIGYCVAKVVN